MALEKYESRKLQVLIITRIFLHIPFCKPAKILSLISVSEISGSSSVVLILIVNVTSG